MHGEHVRGVLLSIIVGCRPCILPACAIGAKRGRGARSNVRFHACVVAYRRDVIPVGCEMANMASVTLRDGEVFFRGGCCGGRVGGTRGVLDGGKR